jgi:hypothetical protein
MRRLGVLALMVLLVPAAGARVWTTVYHCNEATPLEAVDPNHPTVYRDIMVGTRLVIVICSDVKGPWTGNLVSSWDDWIYGELGARGYNAKTRNYDGSCLPAAGGRATVLDGRGPSGVGFQFVARQNDAIPGEWFMLDYRARQVGSCELVLTEVATETTYGKPSLKPATFIREVLSFRHVPSRDFNGDAIVDFKDFVLLTLHWNAKDHGGFQSRNPVFDLNADGFVGFGDLALFGEYWLQRTDCHPPATDPNAVVSNP